MVNSFLSSNERKYSLYTSTDSIGINVDSEEESVPDDIQGLTSTSTQVQLQLETSFIQLLTPKESNEETQCIRFMSDSKCLILSNSHEMKEWHQQPIEMVLEILDVDPTHGLVLDQVQQRKNTYGLNTLVTEKKTPVIILFLLQFMNLIIGLLVAAAIAAIALQEWVEGIGILVIVILNAVIATLQEKKAGEALDALQQMSSPKCLVLREGTLQSIPSEDIVPGDVIHLTTGDIVPADLRLIHNVDLKVNEMILTGESEDVVKKQETICTSTDPLTARNMVFSSTLVTTGNAVGITVETGMKTRVGTIASLLQRPRTKKTNRIVQFMEKYQPKQTPLQHSLHKLGLVMGIIVIIICLIVFGVGMIRGDVDPKHPNRPLWLYMVMAAVSLAVSAVPEGLPMVVTICLSTGTSDMVKQNVLVRKLVAVESLGASSVICTDKTGTLTEGKMTAINIWGDQKTYTVTGRGFEPVGDILFNGVSQIHSNVQVRATLLSATLCSNTTLQQQTTDDGHMEWVPRGNASEAPLVVAAAKAGIWFESLKETFPRMVEIPFCSTRKMMITVSKVPMVDARPYFENLSLPLSTQFIMNVKGAPHYIIDKCINYVSTDGSIVPMESDDIQDVLTAVDELSSQSLRVLAVAICPIAVLPFELEEDVDQKYKALCTKPWTLVGLIASMDPPRPGVKKSIQQARDASIRTVMITGDYYKTAVAIAKKIDLLQDTDLEGQAIDCKILRPNGTYLKPYEVDEITRHCSVFARAKPEDKMEIVQSLQRQGHVTAMTGDGVNDAPALQESDIGIAMGISGTAVAQRLSDMILTDDNYCSIVAAVEKGREIYTNIQRFVCFLLSTNFGEITLIFIAIAIGLPTPLAPLQILVLNVFADGMAAVALSLEKGDGTVMKECPRPRSQPIIYGRLWIIVMINALLIAIGALIVFSTGLYWNFGKIFLKDITGEMNPLDYPNATCSRWLGSNNGWQIYTSCDSSSYKDDGTMYCVDDIGYNCISHGISRAQTMTFVFITHMEMLRAYTARSFTQSMFYHFFSNRFMQIAAIGMIGLTLSITNIPFLKDQVFGLASIAWFEWVYAIAIAIFMITLGELMKWCYRCRDGNKRKWKELYDELMQTMEELRYVRGRMQGIEDKLEIVLDHQEKRDLHMESPLHSSTSASNSSDSSDAETQK